MDRPAGNDNLLKLLSVAESRVRVIGVQLVRVEAVALLHSPATCFLVEATHVGVCATHLCYDPLGLLYAQIHQNAMFLESLIYISIAG